ncbi:MAG: hypothetical protein RI897_4077 [Verrucomicrobiota bacterium]
MHTAECGFLGGVGRVEEVGLGPAEGVGCINHGGIMPEGVGHRLSKGSAPGARGSWELVAGS